MEQAPNPEYGTARERLLEAAAGLFAESGCDAVSIRDITRAAGVRHGGINYHFGTKEDLYHEVLLRFGPAAGRTLNEQEPAENLSPEQARTLLIEVLEKITALELKPMDPVAAGLVRGEISRRDGPNERLFEEVIRPGHEWMARMIGRVFPDLTDDRERSVAAVQIMAQCIFLRIARPVVLKLLGVEEFDPELSALVTRRMIETTLNGLGSRVVEHP